VESADAAWLERYVSVLGLTRESPGPEYLRKLTRAHLSRVPFENVTSILRRANVTVPGEPVPSLDREVELHAWAERRGGGLCFEVVDMFGALLSALGFTTHPALGTISFPGAHQANVVDVAGERYLVDAGNGAPFFEPILLSDAHTPIEISQCGLSYRFRAHPERSDAWIQDRLIDGNWQSFCTYYIAPAREADRQAAYQRHHVVGRSWVVDNLTLVRCTDTDVWSLRDDRLTHFSASGRKSSSTLDSPQAYREVASDLFDLPKAPITDALDALRRRASSDRQ
jgi:N-hydroxyarylamine O-acetyltransferase